METATHPLEGISLVWWPTLLQNSVPSRELLASDERDENEWFTGLLHSLATALTCAESCDLEEEITLP